MDFVRCSKCKAHMNVAAGSLGPTCAEIVDGRLCDGLPERYYPQRADYMAGKVNHHAWYSSVAAAAGLKYTNPDVVKTWAEALAKGDEHLNSLPLQYWDRFAAFAQPQITRALKLHGDFWSLAGGVCVVKAAARNAVEEFNRKEVS